MVSKLTKHIGRYLLFLWKIWDLWYCALSLHTRLLLSGNAQNIRKCMGTYRIFTYIFPDCINSHLLYIMLPWKNTFYLTQCISDPHCQCAVYVSLNSTVHSSHIPALTKLGKSWQFHLGKGSLYFLMLKDVTEDKLCITVACMETRV